MKKDDKTSRKEAVKKISKYAALTALGTFIILSPRESQAQSGSNPAPLPDDDFF